MPGDGLTHNRVFVGGISWKADETSLKNYFETFGPVIECKIIMDRVTGCSKGYGFVTFADAETSATVKKQSNLYFLGKMMNVGDAYRKIENGTPTPGVPMTGAGQTNRINVQAYRQPGAYNQQAALHNQAYVNPAAYTQQGYGYAQYGYYTPYQAAQYYGNQYYDPAMLTAYQGQYAAYYQQPTAGQQVPGAIGNWPQPMITGQIGQGPVITTATSQQVSQQQSNGDQGQYVGQAIQEQGGSSPQ
eukprot:TRINITY_DN672_c0_g1_i2.p1 TRINITY_DN672_c0_g1~~TRINITY_DN672_c0_g1_i2.p1  ORF type:complete len:245 (-),score=54.92 TRINITY_DN672_c0_g1_i2:231-965(-)